MVKGLYIHIPFCHQICHYCDFNKVFFENQPVDRYIEMLGRELDLWKASGALNSPMETVFFGGGTPTALDPGQLERLLGHVRRNVVLAEGCEWTSEANPDELNRAKLDVLFAGGVNRLSMGVQSFDEDLLGRLGRTHGNGDVDRAITEAREAGFTNISLDLMYGLPGQTMDQWEKTLDRAFSYELPHFSAYSLIVEPKTVFYNLLMKGKLRTPGEDLEAEMYRVLMERMAAHGLHQYEISNFAKPGRKSRHNLLYWNNEEYIGAGAGSHGYVDGVRYSNHGPLKKYMAPLEEWKRPVLQEQAVSPAEQMEEEMFLGLRKNEGVSETLFREKFNVSLDAVYGEKLEKLLAIGNLERSDGFVRLTDSGRFVGNDVFSEFLLGD
ncbi:radical SAM family heme chaperone HemW [Indiicoccus explosivorum]|uniref:radical SAM family heme chaperone HemW n=1 Tax=Indiicoccus explosivorum TaxID=1917864 RepID=UPI000B43035D|nr:radical SAM family heme chaperone HemW [Indiicoccus explosivorum]